LAGVAETAFVADLAGVACVVPAVDGATAARPVLAGARRAAPC
jgi:hypothetical protein